MPDPNSFHLNWTQTIEVMVMIVLLAFIVERALAVIFETPQFVAWPAGRRIKEIIAIAASIGLCAYWHFDAVSIIFGGTSMDLPGYVITGCIIAGGSKGAVKLFYDVLDVKSNAVRAAS